MTRARYSRVLVVCPQRPLTAGPEALHQLAGRLNHLGQPASVIYHPFGEPFSTPEAYRGHQAPVNGYADEPGTLLVFPEVLAMLALRPRHAESAIWWMSVNNFTRERYRYPILDRLHYGLDVIRAKKPLNGPVRFRHLRHFAQSDYSARYLAAHGLVSEPLSDPIPGFTQSGYLSALARLPQAQRENTILYNPVKGAHITRRLIAEFAQWRFQPLQNLDREQLASAFLNAKLYIDFGHHPGKDRLPREAALHGCCVVCANHGSAASAIDVPIPSDYKLDVRHPDFLRRFGETTAEVLGRFDFHAARFEPYRQVIRREASEFDRQITAAFMQDCGAHAAQKTTSADKPPPR